MIILLQARAGTIPLVQVLKVAEAFGSESNYTVWNDLSMNLGTPLLLSQYTDYYDNAKGFIRRLFTPIGKKLGWDAKENESELILIVLCYMNLTVHVVATMDLK